MLLSSSSTDSLEFEAVVLQRSHDTTFASGLWLNCKLHSQSIAFTSSANGKLPYFIYTKVASTALSCLVRPTPESFLVRSSSSAFSLLYIHLSAKCSCHLLPLRMLSDNKLLQAAGNLVCHYVGQGG